MQEFISVISEVMSISLDLGSVHLSLGGVVLGWLLLKAGIYLYHNLSGGGLEERYADGDHDVHLSDDGYLFDENGHSEKLEF